MYEHCGFVSPNYTMVPRLVITTYIPVLKESEIRVLLVIIRKTFGYSKYLDKISYSQFVKFSGMSRSSVAKGISGLIKKGLIIRISVFDSFYYGLRFPGGPDGSELGEEYKEFNLIIRKIAARIGNAMTEKDVVKIIKNVNYFGSPFFVIVPSTIIDAYIPRLKESELRILLVILRATFGYSIFFDKIAYSQFVKSSGMSRKAVSAGISGLRNKNLIIRIQTNHTFYYGLNFPMGPDDPELDEEHKIYNSKMREKISDIEIDFNENEVTEVNQFSEKMVTEANQFEKIVVTQKNQEVVTEVDTQYKDFKNKNNNKLIHKLAPEKKSGASLLQCDLNKFKVQNIQNDFFKGNESDNLKKYFSNNKVINKEDKINENDINDKKQRKKNNHRAETEFQKRVLKLCQKPYFLSGEKNQVRKIEKSMTEYQIDSEIDFTEIDYPKQWVEHCLKFAGKCNKEKVNMPFFKLIMYINNKEKKNDFMRKLYIR